LIHFFVSLIELRKPASAAAGDSGESLPAAAKLYLMSVLTAGMVLLIGATLYWHSDNALRFACYLTMAAIAATLKVSFPASAAPFQ
jgi:hypothetical protein